MKQVLGEKKRQRCEAITGRAYRVAYTSGNYGHGWAECWFGEGETVYDADMVNYQTGEWQIKARGSERACV